MLMSKKNIKTNKYVIGCANFGQKYGLRQKNFKLNEFEQIFKLCIKNNILYFDTAADYGNSEKLLGDIISKQKIPVNIITKLTKKRIFRNFDNELENQVLKSIKRLRVKRIYTIHIHEPDMFLKKDKFKIYNSLLKLKKKKLIKNIGVSVYTVQELKQILETFKIDIVQIPINLLDQRFIKNKLLKKIKKKVKEIHARSIFLKGILLKDSYSRPKYFNKWPVFKKIDSFFNEKKISRLAACMKFVFNIAEVDRVIIGVSSKSQFNKILKISKKIQNIDVFPNLNVVDKNLLIPKYWKI